MYSHLSKTWMRQNSYEMKFQLWHPVNSCTWAGNRNWGGWFVLASLATPKAWSAYCAVWSGSQACVLRWETQNSTFGHDMISKKFVWATGRVMWASGTKWWVGMALYDLILLLELLSVERCQMPQAAILDASKPDSFGLLHGAWTNGMQVGSALFRPPFSGHGRRCRPCRDKWSWIGFDQQKWVKIVILHVKVAEGFAVWGGSGTAAQARLRWATIFV